MITIQGFTPPPNHATMGVESTILDNLTPAPSDMSGQGEPDMSAKLKQRAVINGKVFWLTGSTQQELFQSYLSHAITEGVVVPPDENGQHRKDGLSTRFSDIAERWFTLYKVGKVRETTLTGYESYLKRHVLPYFGEISPSTTCSSFSTAKNPSPRRRLTKSGWSSAWCLTSPLKMG